MHINHGTQKDVRNGLEGPLQGLGMNPRRLCQKPDTLSYILRPHDAVLLHTGLYVRDLKSQPVSLVARKEGARRVSKLTIDCAGTAGHPHGGMSPGAGWRPAATPGAAASPWCPCPPAPGGRWQCLQGRTARAPAPPAARWPRRPACARPGRRTRPEGGVFKGCVGVCAGGGGRQD